MAGYDVGLKLGIDGEAEFRKQINAVSTQIKTLGTEMGVVTAQFAKNASGQEALGAKTAVLNKQIDAQREKLALQQDMLAKATDKFGEASAETQTWQQVVNKTQAQIYKLENTLAATNDTIDDTGDSLDEAGDSALTFGDVLKANVIGDAIVSGVKKLASAIKDMAGEFIESAASLKAQTAQFEQTFGDFGGEAEAAIGRVADASGILDTRLKGTGTQIYAFARSAGADTSKGLDIMERALTVAADSAAYYDRSLEDTAESLQSFLKGNYANDAALGLSATETTRNAAAMDLFGQKFKDLTEIQKQETLLKMVEDSMKLSGAMGQAQREADGWENVQGNLTEAWKQFQAVIGTPILDNLVPLLKEGTTSLQNMTENTDWAAFGEGVSKSFEGVAKLASGIMSTVISATQIPAVSTVFENLATVISTLTVAMIAYKSASAISGVVDKLKAATESQTIAQAALNAVMNANPFVLVATLIAGVVTALVTLYKTNEDFRDKVNVAWVSFKQTVSSVVSSVVTFFTETIPNAGREMLEFFKSIPGMALEWGRDLIQSFIDGIKEKIRALKDTVSNVAQTVKDFLGFSEPKKGPLSNFHTYAPDMMELFASGILANKKTVQNALEDALFFPPNVSGSYADLAGTMRQGRSNLDSSLDRATANMVNGVSTAMSGGNGDLVVKVNVGDAELARAILPAFRQADRANPEVVSDPI